MKQVDEFQKNVENLCTQAKTDLMVCGNGQNKDGFSINYDSIKGNIRVVEQLIEGLKYEKDKLNYLEYEDLDGVKFIVRDNYCLKKDKVDILYLKQRLFNLYKEHFINNLSKENKGNTIIEHEIESLIKIINTLK